MSYYGWKPYVPVAARQAKSEKAAAQAKKAGASLTPIAPFRGAMAKTFWGKAWCDNLEHYSDYENRLPRGRTYVRNGSVIDLQITPGQLQAKVMGSSLYTVTASVTVVPQTQWKTICTDCSGSIDSLVELLQGKLSNAVMERICKPGSGLFPSPGEITFNCSCPDWASMCKHVAAVLYGVGARLDKQPEVLFTLRRVDARDLVSQAGTGLPAASKRPASGKLLADALLADMFGIEMAEVPLPAKPAPGSRRPRKVETKNQPQPAPIKKQKDGKKQPLVIKATEKKPVKPAAPTPRQAPAAVQTTASKKALPRQTPAKPSASPRKSSAGKAATANPPATPKTQTLTAKRARARPVKKASSQKSARQKD